MKIKKNKLKVEDAFEIAINQTEWQKIKNYADENGITYSWVTRLCTFRLMKQITKKNKKIDKVNKQVRIEYKRNLEKKHRHMMCLFGEDAIQIRIYAAKCGLTITQFVRIAIFLYLKYFSRNLSESTLLYYGTKLISQIVQKIHNKLKLYPYIDKDYWTIKYCVRYNLR